MSRLWLASICTASCLVLSVIGLGQQKVEQIKPELAGDWKLTSIKGSTGQGITSYRLVLNIEGSRVTITRDYAAKRGSFHFDEVYFTDRRGETNSRYTQNGKTETVKSITRLKKGVLTIDFLQHSAPLIEGWSEEYKLEKNGTQLNMYASLLLSPSMIRGSLGEVMSRELIYTLLFQR